MIKVIVVDDERLSLDELTLILKQDNELKIIGAFDDSVEAIDMIIHKKPDVVFVDISMPEINGFHIAEEILNRKLDTLVVFVTAFNEHALNAFELEAIDYVLKPFSERRIKKSLETVKKRIKSNNHNTTNINKVLNVMDAPNLKRLPAWKNGSIKLIDLIDVYYCEVLDKKTYIITKEDKYEFNGSLNAFEQRVGGIPFFRCYKSYIVNLDYVDKIIPMFNQTYILNLKEIEKDIPVSRHYAQSLRQLLKF